MVRPNMVASRAMLLLLLMRCLVSDGAPQMFTQDEWMASASPCHTLNAMAQDRQDLYVSSIFNSPFLPPRQRTFVELGANDGKTLSNTYLLEKCHSWRGVCIEPTSAAFSKLESSGRSLCHLVKAVVAGSVRDALFVGDRGGVQGLEDGGTLWAGLQEHLVRSRGNEKGGEAAISLEAYRLVLSEEGVGPTAVQTTTLDKILDDAKFPLHIDYLSLDVEGAEMEILSSFPFHLRSFGLLTVETSYNASTRSALQLLLRSKGYARVRCTYGSDDVYVLASLVLPGGELSLAQLYFDEQLCGMAKVTRDCRSADKGAFCRQHPAMYEGSLECDMVWEKSHCQEEILESLLETSEDYSRRLTHHTFHVAFSPQLERIIVRGKTGRDVPIEFDVSDDYEKVSKTFCGDESTRDVLGVDEQVCYDAVLESVRSRAEGYYEKQKQAAIALVEHEHFIDRASY